MNKSNFSVFGKECGFSYDIEIEQLIQSLKALRSVVCEPFILSYNGLETVDFGVVCNHCNVSNICIRIGDKKCQPHIL